MTVLTRLWKSSTAFGESREQAVEVQREEGEPENRQEEQEERSRRRTSMRFLM
jgi:hypothetical protein